MNRDDTLTLLRTRSALTSQPYSDDVADAWLAVLAEWTLAETRTALIRAARQHKRIAVADLVELLPSRAPLPPARPAEPDVERISLDEYLERLQQRARRDRRAADELVHWAKACPRRQLGVPITESLFPRAPDPDEEF